MFKEDLNRIEVDNIRLVVDYYDHKRVITKVDYIKHLIARKKIVVDMKSKPLDFYSLADMLKFPMEGTVMLLGATEPKLGSGG